MAQKYTIIWDTRVRKQDFKKISTMEVTRIVSKVESFLAENPHAGVAIKGHYKGLYRYRIGDYRVIYDLQDAQITIRIIRVGHRREVYE